MIITEQTKATAQAVYDYIIMNPEKHDQSNWVGLKGDYLHDINEHNFCNTTMCIAGTAVYLEQGIAGMKECARVGGYMSTAGPLLGLSSDESMRLFLNLNNDTALDQLNAIANGDEEKFLSISQGLDD